MMRQLKMFDRYVVMGWHERGGNGIYYTESLEDAIDVALTACEQGHWKRKATVRRASVHLRNAYDYPDLSAAFERAGIDIFHGIPVYETRIGKEQSE